MICRYRKQALQKPNNLTTLPDKLTALSTAGFTGIELGLPDLLSFACTFHSKDIQEDDYDALCTAGIEVQRLCKHSGLQIMMLQPFSNFEGWPIGSAERADAFTRARGWIRIMQAVGTDMLQVGSTDSPSSKITGDLDDLAADLAELADLLAPHRFKLAYENWCWATHVPTWRDAWDIVQRVDRPNVGLCLDTFQTVAGEVGDPTTGSGYIERKSKFELERDFKASMENLAREVPAEKIFVLQLSDMYKPPTPFASDGENGEANEKGPGGEKVRARAKWSHDYRPYFYNGGMFTGECVEMCEAVLKTGFRGWFSVEVFDGRNRGGEGDMETYAKGAMESCRRMLGEIGWLE